MVGQCEKVARFREGLVLLGPLRHEIQLKDKNNWWIFIRGTIVVDGRKDEDFVLHHMNIYVSEKKAQSWHNFQIIGKYALGPIKKFREILARYLKTLSDSHEFNETIKKGMEILLEQLSAYSDARKMMEEVQEALKKLDLNRPSSVEVLRSILHELRETSDCDVSFEEQSE